MTMRSVVVGVLLLLGIVPVLVGQTTQGIGQFEKHIVEIVWSGTCIPVVRTTNVYLENSISVPLSSQSAPLSCVDSNVTFSGTLTVNYPITTPTGNVDAIKTLTFSQPMTGALGLDGNLDISRVPPSNTQRITSQLGPSDVAQGICPPASATNGGPTLVAGSYPISLQSQCGRTAMTFPAQQGPDLLYEVRSFASIVLAEPAFPSGQKILVTGDVTVRTLYLVSTSGVAPPTVSLSNITPPTNQLLVADPVIQYQFGADITYTYNSDTPASLELEVVEPTGIPILRVSNSISRTLGGPQTATYMTGPSTLISGEEGSHLRARIISGGITRAQAEAPPWPAGTDELLVLEQSPVHTLLTDGSVIDFAARVQYKLGKYETGDLEMELLNNRGELIVSTGPKNVFRTQTSQTMDLSLPGITVTAAMTNITARVRLNGGGTVLKENSFRHYAVGETNAMFLEVVGVTGDPEVKVPGGDWVPVTVGMKLRAGSQLSTGPDCQVRLLYPDSSVMLLQELTEVLVSTLLREGNAVHAQVSLKIGEVSAQVNPAKQVTSDFNVRTPVATASVRGTEFTVAYQLQPEPAATLVVTNGTVDFVPANPLLPTLIVTTNHTAQITATSVTMPEAPVITSLSASSAVAGTQITISGLNFHSTASSNTVSFGGFWGNVVNASPTSLTVVVPECLATNYEPVTVTVAGLTSNAKTLFVMAAHPPTTVFASPTGLWTRAASPYLIPYDLAVVPGATLQIEPGVVVLMQGLSVDLHIQGTLIAEGANGAPIRFTCMSTNKAGTQWGALLFYDTSTNGPARLVNAQVEAGGYFRYGEIESYSARPRLERTIVRASGVNGIYLADSAPVITNCVFLGNTNSAIIMDVASFPTLRGNFACQNGYNGVSVYNGNMTRSGTWMSDGLPYQLLGDIIVAQGKQLTIEPGAQIEFGPISADLFVDGTLTAIGTEASSIVFTSDDTNKVRGQWGGIIIDPTSTNTVLDHCTVEYGGYFRYGDIEIYSASPAIRKCAIGDSSAYGLAMWNGAAPQITDCTFLNNSSLAMSMGVDCFPLLTNNAASSNLVNSIAVQGGTLYTNGTWLRDAIPYDILGDIVIASNAVLTIQPGATVQFDYYSVDLWVDGGLIARGTTLAPIRFTTSKVPPLPGIWGAIIIDPTSNDSVTALENCIVEYGGYFRYGNVEVRDAAPSLNKLTARYGSANGVYIAGGAPRISQCNFVSNSAFAITMEAYSLPLVTNNAAVSNGNNSIGIYGGNVSTNTTWQPGGVPYTLIDDVVVLTNRTLTIQPGTTVQGGYYSVDLWVDGFLDARGTLAKPIRFTTDKAVPVPGLWGAVLFRNTGTPSLLQNCTFEYGGYFRYGNVELYASPSIADCTFQNCSSAGIYAENSASDIERCRFLNNLGDGIGVYATAPLQFQAHNSILSSNGGWGVRNYTTQVMAAQSNYWGAVNGPFDNANTDGLNLLNPGGLGNKVTEYVQWSNYTTNVPASITNTPPPFSVAVQSGLSGNVMFTWPADYPDAVVERSVTLGPTAFWLPAELVPANVAGKMQIVIPPNGPSSYYRLRLP